MPRNALAATALAACVLTAPALAGSGEMCEANGLRLQVSRQVAQNQSARQKKENLRSNAGGETTGEDRAQQVQDTKSAKTKEKTK